MRPTAVLGDEFDNEFDNLASKLTVNWPWQEYCDLLKSGLLQSEHHFAQRQN
jgi:hypothetical protein